ncbi:DUF4276 family protein [Prevotella dentasini]|uniref:DUF4276 family protein n=1 Tax=Prevotella dentasini TaxID=589537 RepID=UPI000469130A|nr:DUF4276 family protein [Prevotella dentasini]
MKRLLLIVEGETEENFVNDVLRPYFSTMGIYNSVQCFKTKHSNGGLSKYSYIKKDILNTIYEKDVIVSTMIDFYRLPSDFPGFNKLQESQTHQEQVSILEAEIKIDIENMQKRKFDNFIPYIQLHEFEALVFSSVKGFDSLFERNEIDYQGIVEVIQDFPNPEDINNHPNTAPSMRLKKLIPGYNKVVYGIEIIKAVGMTEILKTCPRFSMWIEIIKAALA